MPPHPWFSDRLPKSVSRQYILPDTTLTIDIDYACRECGYNLRTQRVHGRCPECGTRIDFKELPPYRLEFAARYWVRTLWFASLLLACSFGVVSVGLVLAIVNSELPALRCFACATIVLIVSGFLFTRCEPPRPRPRTWRWLTRFILVLLGLCLILTGAQEFRYVDHSSWALALIPFFAGASVLFIFVHLHVLALLLDEYKLADRLIYFAVASPVFGGVLTTLLLVTYWRQSQIQLAYSALFSCSALIAFPFVAMATAYATQLTSGIYQALKANITTN